MAPGNTTPRRPRSGPPPWPIQQTMNPPLQVLPTGVTTSETTPFQAWRNNIAGHLANRVLRVATPQYRSFVANSLRYGLQAALEATAPEPRPPLTVGCGDCGADPDHKCVPLPGEDPDSTGYHHARYDAAGWPRETDDPSDPSDTDDQDGLGPDPSGVPHE